mgnify:CR=1 FL=1
MTAEKTLLPHAAIAAWAVKTAHFDLYLFGDSLRESKKGQFLQFSAFFESRELRFVVAGFRLQKGRIYGPAGQKFKTFFPHFWAGETLRRALHVGVGGIKRDLELHESWETATETVTLTVSVLETLNKKCDNKKVAL